jgi:peptidoglycan/LPS O-acetylase OafA/YrhL
LEFAVNLLYATIIVRRTTRVLAAVALLSCVTAVAVAVYLGSWDTGWGWENLVGGASRTIASFSLGVLIYRLQLKPRAALSLIAPIAFLIVGIALIALPLGRIWVDGVVAFVLFPLFLVVAAQTEPPRALTWIFHQSGRMSYAVYILHGPLIFWLSGVYKLTLHKDPLQAAPLSGYVILAAVIVLSTLLTVLFDEPVRRLANRWIGRRHTIERLGSENVTAQAGAEVEPQAGPRVASNAPQAPVR